jgi:uncharacterized protein YjbI with pentapeptide repeats
MPIEGIVAHTALVERTALRVSDTQAAQQNNLSAGGTPLTAGDFSPGNLIRADFSGQSFAGTDLTGAVLKSANLANAGFSDAVLRDALLTNAVVTGATFFRADLRGANLAGALGLTADQLIGARIDITTILPVGV